MIGIQSFLINTVGNFAVEEDTITSAACEEGNCAAGDTFGFVNCSGANRWRMGIVSAIARPKEQMCNIVDVDWAELFPDLHPYDPDYVPQ